jgi:hypothetical protein
LKILNSKLIAKSVLGLILPQGGGAVVEGGAGEFSQVGYLPLQKYSCKGSIMIGQTILTLKYDLEVVFTIFEKRWKDMSQD